MHNCAPARTVHVLPVLCNHENRARRRWPIVGVPPTRTRYAAARGVPASASLFFFSHLGLAWPSPQPQQRLMFRNPADYTTPRVQCAVTDSCHRLPACRPRYLAAALACVLHMRSTSLARVVCRWIEVVSCTRIHHSYSSGTACLPLAASQPAGWHLYTFPHRPRRGLGRSHGREASPTPDAALGARLPPYSYIRREVPRVLFRPALHPPPGSNAVQRCA